MSVSGQDKRGVIRAATNAYSSVNATSAAGTAWVEVIASTSAPILITGISVRTILSSGNQVTVASVGTGAAASETVVWTGNAIVGMITGTGSVGNNAIWSLPIPIRVAASTRVAIRSDNTGAVVTVQYVSESAVL